MSERVNLCIIGVLTMALILAGYMTFLGKVGEAKEIAVMIVSGLIGAIGGHASARAAIVNDTVLPPGPVDPLDLTGAELPKGGM